MSNKSLRKVILLAVLSLLGITAYQAYLLQKANALQKSRQNDLTFVSLNNVAEELYKLNPQSGKIINPVKDMGNNRFIVQVNDTLHPYLLESLLKQEFKRLDINSKFEYAIYDCFTDATVFGKTVNINSDSLGDASYLKNMEWTDDGHYFGVYFPSEKKLHLLPSIDITLLLIPLAIIFLFFGYTLMVLFKEKRFSEMRMDFVNHLSHELKTPVTTIKLVAKSLIAAPDHSKDKYLQIISTESDRLKRLIDKSLASAQLESDIKVNINVVELTPLIDELVTWAQKLFEGIKIQAEIEKDLSVKADKHHLDAILMNLVENSHKYSKNQATEVTIKVFEDQETVNIRVEDKGVGIPKNLHQKVFKKFYRADNNTAATGHGLGLYFAKMYLKKFGAHIHIDPNYENGTAFQLEFPQND